MAFQKGNGFFVFLQEFGQVRAVKETPGLGVKIPFIQNVVFYDSRIQGIDTPSLEVTPLDDRRLIVDAF
ncbi:MAG TPA: protease modulator HflC, partial [Acidobacteriota bacterium]|nr:protease modulator HflC [Acidobacteriota bacterium]